MQDYEQYQKDTSTYEAQYVCSLAFLCTACG